MSRRKSRAIPTIDKAIKERPPANLQAAASASPGPSVAKRSRALVLAQSLLPLLLIGIGLAAYYNSFGGVFLFDDQTRIVENPQIHQLWPPWASMAGSSRPILQLSLALNYAIGGLNPWGYHAFNLAVHVIAGLLLFGIVRRMLESDTLRARYGEDSHWLALAVAGIWLVHPLQTASVTYIIQRAESLMGLFFLLTLYCGIRACKSRHRLGWSIAAVIACALGMGSKEVMVSAPILMWLYDWTFISRTFSETFRRRGWLYAGLAATWLVLVTSSATSQLDAQEYMVAGLTPWSYLITQCEVIVHYLRLALWPRPLVFDYAWPIADPLSSVLPSAVVVLALLGSTALALYRRLWPGFWGAWFFLVLAPTSSIMPIADVAFEHRMYLPLAAVVVLVVLVGHDLFGRLGQWLRVSAYSRGWIEAALVVAAVTVLGYETARRNDDYRSELAMWSDTVAKRPANPRAHNNLGNGFLSEGKHKQALIHFEQAVRLKPDYSVAQYNLGSTKIELGQIDQAIVHLTEAVRLRPQYADAHNNLATALIEQGRNEEAAVHFSQAANLKPDSAKAHNALGSALHFQGRNTEAIAEYSKAVRLEPGFAEAHHNLGMALLDSGELAGSIAPFSEALRLRPTMTKAHINLAVALMKQGRIDEAITHYSEALLQKPDNAMAHNGLASALGRKGKFDEAIAHYNEALRLKPDYADAHYNLGNALGGRGQVDLAIAQYREALRLKPNYAEAQNNWGAALYRQGHIKDAIAHFGEAVRLNPSYPDAQNNLGAAVRAQGKKE